MVEVKDVPRARTRGKRPPRNTGRASCAAGSNMNSKSHSAAPSVSLTAITDHLRNYRKETASERLEHISSNGLYEATRTPPMSVLKGRSRHSLDLNQGRTFVTEIHRS
jgi:hypothetical protein